MNRIDKIHGIQEIQKKIGARESLFPMNFLAVVFEKLGGSIKGAGTDRVDFAFPRPSGSIIRSHDLNGGMRYEPGNIGIESLTYTESHSQIGHVDIGHPNQAEAKHIRQLHQLIWDGDLDALYPVDIHSDQFDLPTTLVARDADEVIGFLFGFWRYADGSWQIESNLLGIVNKFRGQNVAFYLKIKQAELAIEKNIRKIRWTVDPLQLPNGVLNFNKLGGKAKKFFPNLYPCANGLNQTPSSRLELSWDLNDSQVQKVLHTYSSKDPAYLSLDYFDDLQIAQLDTYPQTKHIAIEIPKNWTLLQQRDKDYAMKWRKQTDELLIRLIELYTIKAIAFDGERPYLIGERE